MRVLRHSGLEAQMNVVCNNSQLVSILLTEELDDSLLAVRLSHDSLNPAQIPC